MFEISAVQIKCFHDDRFFCTNLFFHHGFTPCHVYRLECGVRQLQLEELRVILKRPRLREGKVLRLKSSKNTSDRWWRGASDPINNAFKTCFQLKTSGMLERRFPRF